MALKIAWANWGGGYRDGPQFHPFRFESATTKGIPDVLAMDSSTGQSLWIELKALTLPVRHTTRLSLTLRPEQAVWLLRWVRAGGRAAILAGFRNAAHWLWCPVPDSVRWAQTIVAPGGWRAVPHLIGEGPIPIPPVLWHLPADGRRVAFTRPPGPMLKHVAIPWPETDNRTGHVVAHVPGMRLRGQLTERAIAEVEDDPDAL